MKILAIETSCDETAVAVVEANGEFPGQAGGADFSYTVLGNALLSQAALHAEYGGVFPNLAKREHGRNLVPITMEALRVAKLFVEGQSDVEESTIANIGELLSREHELFEYLGDFLRNVLKPDIDAIAVTVGPGLEPALWVGINFAKALAQAWHLPIIPVDHMEGHIIIGAMKDGRASTIEFPVLALLVSGGHTELILMREWMQYEILGATRDDAAGEAFDKTARLLGLTYPGGPEISRLAEEARANELLRTTKLPRPMLDDKSFEFSFAGLKTAVSREVAKNPVFNDEQTQELAREIEDAIVEVLVKKTVAAAEKYGARAVIVGGGVSANQHLRAELIKKMTALDSSMSVLFPPVEFSTDNALMIALAGFFRAQKKQFAAPESLKAVGNLKLA